MKDKHTWERETTLLYREPCDCGSHIRHNNGGNYHKIERLHTFTDDEHWCVVIERTSTREDFPRDRYQDLVRSHEFGFELVLGGRYSHLTEEERGAVVATFRYGEAEIVAQA
jgi:hypothetical protein